MVHRWNFHRVPDGLTLQPDHRSPTPPLAGGVFCSGRSITLLWPWHRS